MSTISTSVSDCTFSPIGLPDELSPTAQAQFVYECNAWHDDRRAVEAEHESDYFEQIAHLRRQNEQIAALTAEANRQRDLLDAEIKAHCAAMKFVNEKLASIFA